MNTSTRKIAEHLFQNYGLDQLGQQLEALLTPSEIEKIATRLEISRLLQQGVPQRQIAQQLGVGIATVTRGSRELKAGKF